MGRGQVQSQGGWCCSFLFCTRTEVRICFGSGEEIVQLETLEGQWRAALDKQKIRKRHVKQLEEDLQVHVISSYTFASSYTGDNSVC